MIATEPETLDLIDQARRFAALSGSFNPRDALPKGTAEDRRKIVDVATALAAKCDTNPDQGDRWLLRTGERRYILQALRKGGRLAEAIAERRRFAELDQETDDLLAAITGEGSFSRAAIARDLAEPPSIDRLRRVVVALDRAGEEAPAGGLLTEARASLAKAERNARRRLLHERGFFGRAAQIASLLQFLETPYRTTPVGCAFVSGLPGIGKSALIEEVTNRITATSGGLNVRLDFDRAGLDILDVRGLTMEVARQLGERLGAEGSAILEKRLEAASYQPGEDSSARSQQSVFPVELATVMAKSVQQSNRPVLIILDTLEVLRARGHEHPRKLFEWLDQLVEHDLKPLRILAAGRGEALDACPARVGLPVSLHGLDPDATDQLLDRLEVAPADRPEVARVADGNPLVLRLAAQIAAEHGKESLPPGTVAKDTAAAFLYRFLLSRIEEPVLQRLAHPGLVLRRINAELLGEVVAPQVGLEELSAEEAKSMFDLLANEHWLVEPDPYNEGFVIHRGDMRLALLPLLYSSKPKVCARIDAAAAKWFGRRKDPQSQLDAAYHRLQRMRVEKKSRPLISQQVAFGFDRQMLAELPDKARDLVLRTTGGRTEQFRAQTSYSGRSDDEALASELNRIIDKQDWAEGQYLVGQALDDGGFDARSTAADAIRTFFWRAGRWQDAKRLLAEHDRLGGTDADIGSLPRPFALARLEMRAEAGRLTARSIPLALEMVRDERSGGTLAVSRHGALAFRLLARGADPREGSDLKRTADPVAAATELWGGGTGYAVRQALDQARERLMARGAGFVGRSEGVDAQLISVHTPYAPVAANLATQDGFHWLGEEAFQAEQRLCAMGALFEPPLSRPPEPSKANPIAGIAGLGLFAEWIGLLGFWRRDPTLRALGRAAERWRQTMAGNWRYGRPPRGWAGPPLLDATLAARLDALRTKSAAAALLDELMQSADAFGQLERRIAGRILKAYGAETTEAAAALLARSDVPSAIVPPLAALIGRDSQMKRR